MDPRRRMPAQQPGYNQLHLQLGRCSGYNVHTDATGACLAQPTYPLASKITGGSALWGSAGS